MCSGYINCLISNSFKMTTLNENSLPHNLYNDQIHFSESDKDLKETGYHDFLSDIYCCYYNITGFNSDITIKNYISILVVNIRSLNNNFNQFLNYINSLDFNDNL